MKKVERYFYPAVFTFEPNQEIAVTFPDLGVATSGENEDDALISAKTSVPYLLTYICPLSVWHRLIVL